MIMLSDNIHIQLTVSSTATANVYSKVGVTLGSKNLIRTELRAFSMRFFFKFLGRGRPFLSITYPILEMTGQCQKICSTIFSNLKLSIFSPVEEYDSI